MSQKRLNIFAVFLLFVFCSCSAKKDIQVNKEISSTNKQTQDNLSNVESQPHADIPTSVDNLELDLEKAFLLIQDNVSEITRLKSEILYLQNNQIESMPTPQEILSNPFDVYNKKIILNNGTTFFGNIIYQDNLALQVETLIGTLVLSKNDIIRVVDHKMLDLENTQEILNVIKNPEHSVKNIPENLNLAEIVLLGEFQETLDANNNTILSGRVQNTGKKRADFIKVNFTIYKDRKYNQKPAEYTVFIDGSIQEFENNVISNSSLSPSAIGEFSLVVPNDFGPFISYSYNIDWEQYD